MKKIVIIGGGAAGPKTAAKAKRLNPENEIELYTDENMISYSACGLPYFIEGTVKNINQLIVRTPEDFEKQGVKIFLEHKAQKIIPEKNRALRNSIYQTNKKYPNSIQERLVRLVSEYKTTGKINANLFTGNGRAEFKRYFSGDSDRDMEDLLGLFLDSYADLSYANFPNALTEIIKQKGKDYFRENMIRSILHDDYSGFTSENEIYAIRNMIPDNILYTISGEYIEKSLRIGWVEESQANYQYSIQPAEIKTIAEKRRFGISSKITDGLISNKEKDSRRQNELIFEN